MIDFDLLDSDGMGASNIDSMTNGLNQDDGTMTCPDTNLWSAEETAHSPLSGQPYDSDALFAHAGADSPLFESTDEQGHSGPLGMHVESGVWQRPGRHGDDDSLFNPSQVDDAPVSHADAGHLLHDGSDEQGHAVSFGLHVEDRTANMNHAKHFEEVEKRELREMEKDIKSGHVKEARDHAHAAEMARKQKEEYLHAAEICKK